MKKFSGGTLTNCVTGVGAQGVSVVTLYGLVTDNNSWKWFTAPGCVPTLAGTPALNAGKGGSIANIGSTYYVRRPRTSDLGERDSLWPLQDFFADSGNNQIRRWTQAASPITIVSGLNNPRAVAHTLTPTTLYIAGKGLSRCVRRYMGRTHASALLRVARHGVKLHQAVCLREFRARVGSAARPAPHGPCTHRRPTVLRAQLGR